MTKIYSPEEMNSFSRETLVAVILSMQDQLVQLNTNMERLIEQIASANNHRYGRSSEKLDVIAGQLELELIFNEVEVLTETLYVVEPAQEDVIQVTHRKKSCRRSLALLAASILNAKYVNGLPLYQISQEFLRNDILISRQVMANWVIQCADRYLGLLYNYLHNRMYRFHVL